MNEIAIRAYGKINLGLDVTGRRRDGYHLVRMVMQTVGIHDMVTMKRTVHSEADLRHITLSCNNPAVPAGRSNIAWKAAEKIIAKYDICDSISIHIEKNIPMAAGMAGGSTDAAAVIIGMKKLFDLDMDSEEMDKIALSLGADVPFCLREGTYLAEGIGEILTKLEDAPDASVLVVNPPFEVSTAEVYRELDEMEDPFHPDIDRICHVIRKGSVKELAETMGNILEKVTWNKSPLIREIRDKMKELGAEGSMMTGSGPTVFGLYGNAETAEEALEYFRNRPEMGRSFLTTFIK